MENQKENLQKQLQQATREYQTAIDIAMKPIVDLAKAFSQYANVTSAYIQHLESQLTTKSPVKEVKK